MNAVLADTGFLVALFKHRERLNARARSYLTANRHALLTVAPVIVETCFFLDADEKGALLEWVQRGGIEVAEWPSSAYAQTRAVIAKYADRNIDLADAVLIWLAMKSGSQSILTVDRRDFSVYRLKANRGFDLIDWQH